MISFPDGYKRIYLTANEVISCVIIPALGDFVDDFDVEGIFDDVFVWDEDVHGYVSVVDVVEFWDVVKLHDISDM